MSRQQRRQRERKRQESVFISFLSPGHVSHRFMDSVTQYLQHDMQESGRCSVHGGIISLQTSPRIAAARNTLVENFLVTDGDWLVMIDSDMTFDPTAIDTLIDTAMDAEEDVKIIGGLCFGGGRGDKVFPTLYVLADSERLQIDRLASYPENELVKVSATGAAFICIHRAVLEEMKRRFETLPDGSPNPQIWFRDGVQRGVEFGEDIWFCLAAQGSGFETFVHTGVQIGHVKEWVIGEDDYVDWLRKKHGTT